MLNVLKLKVFFIILVMSTLSSAAPITKEQIKGLDEQVQDIKKDVLSISAELNQLEERLLYPSNTQISLFVSLAEKSGFKPDAVTIELDEKDIANHIYSFKEVEALERGGVQRIFTGNVTTGNHKLKVNIIGRRMGNKKKTTASQTITKGIGPRFVEIQLSASGATIRNW